jgi:hypothetical protein
VKSDFFKKQLFTETQKKTLGEEFLHQELVGLLSAKNFAEGFFWSLPRFFCTLGEEFFAKSPRGSEALINDLHTCRFC